MCPFPAQSFLSVFRSLAMLEKTVERCCISLNDRSSRLVVQLHCKYGEQAPGQLRSSLGGWGEGWQGLLKPCLPVQG